MRPKLIRCYALTRTGERCRAHASYPVRLPLRPEERSASPTPSGDCSEPDETSKLVYLCPGHALPKYMDRQMVCEDVPLRDLSDTMLWALLEEEQRWARTRFLKTAWGVYRQRMWDLMRQNGRIQHIHAEMDRRGL